MSVDDLSGKVVHRFHSILILHHGQVCRVHIDPQCGAVHVLQQPLKNRGAFRTGFNSNGTAFGGGVAGHLPESIQQNRIFRIGSIRGNHTDVVGDDPAIHFQSHVNNRLDLRHAVGNFRNTGITMTGHVTGHTDQFQPVVTDIFGQITGFRRSAIQEIEFFIDPVGLDPLTTDFRRSADTVTQRLTEHFHNNANLHHFQKFLSTVEKKDGSTLFTAYSVLCSL